MFTTGNMRDAASQIDHAIDWVHENFVSPHSAQFGGLTGAVQLAQSIGVSDKGNGREEYGSQVERDSFVGATK